MSVDNFFYVLTLFVAKVIKIFYFEDFSIQSGSFESVTMFKNLLGRLLRELCLSLQISLLT